MDTAHDESPGRILMVEDDAVMAHFMVHILGRHGGFDVACTADPVVALHRAGAETWDLVLTDVELPGMTGVDLLRELRRVCPGVPVAVVTAHKSTEISMRDLREEADEFLEKPIAPDQLRATVTALVARGRAVRGRAAWLR